VGSGGVEWGRDGGTGDGERDGPALLWPTAPGLLRPGVSIWNDPSSAMN